MASAPEDTKKPSEEAPRYQPPAPTGAAYAAYYPHGYGAAARASPPPSYVDTSKIIPPGYPTSSGTVQREYAGKWQDVWAAVIFIVHFVAIQAVAVYLAIKAYRVSQTSSTSTSSTTYTFTSADFTDRFLPLCVAVLVGLIFSWLWLQLVKLAPKFTIYLALWWGVFASAALGILLLTTSESTRFVGIVFLLAAVLQVFYAIAVRPRIPFAATMLRQSISVIRKYPSTIWLSYVALILSLEWILVWLIGATAATALSNSTLIIFLLLISLFWTMEVIRNTIHVTTAGTVATYYFQRLSMPPNPTGRSLGRALTKSFGSICLGSFIVAFLQATREIVAMLASHNNDSAAAAIIASCAECLLYCIESMVRYFNKWAYVQVAVYGKPFVRAARDTWDLFQSQGFHLVINDDLTSGALFMGCFFGGLVTALTSGIYAYTKDETTAFYVAIIAFFIGYFMTYLPMAVIESAVASYYVCYAEDPATLQRNDPAFYEAIRARQTILMQ